MINGIEGIPGAGKSYESVVFHVLPALQAGRKIITNLPLMVEMFVAINPDYAKLIEIRKRAQPVRGTWDFSRVDENGNGEAFQLFEDGHAEPLAASVKPFSRVWCYYTEWKHPTTGQGPLFIIDEVHVALPRVTADEHVREWFSLHRHFNVDVLLMSQRFRKIHPDVSELTAILVRCRKADILGRENSYIRKVHSGYPGAVISTEERPYKPEFFPLYKSHTQGNSVAEASASDVQPFTVKWKRIQYGWWTMTAVVCAYLFWPFGGKADAPPPAKAVAQVKPVASVIDGPSMQSTAKHQAQAVAPSKPAIEAAPAPEVDPDPFAGKKLHLTGWMQVGAKAIFTFTVSDGGRRIFDLQLSELLSAGYRFKALGHCSGILTFADKSRPVTCDAPVLAVGREDRPVVVTEARAPSASTH